MSDSEVKVEHHRPCPFHEPPKRNMLDASIYPNDISKWRVRCIACGANGPVMPTKAEAWAAWDERP